MCKKKLKILVITSVNKGYISPFIREIYESNNYTTVEYFGIKEPGIKGYILNLIRFLKYIKNHKEEFDLIHAHYGLCGILPLFQNKLPYVVTYHGSDLKLPLVKFISKIVSLRAVRNILVEKSMKGIISRKIEMIPCGVNTNIFYKKTRSNIYNLKKKYGKKNNEKWVLFSSSFKRSEKNPKLALDSVNELGGKYKLIELNGYSRIEVSELLNICDCGLLTSFWEGSPQFIKECIACELPVVTVNVGDVEQLLENYSLGKLVRYEKDMIADTIKNLVNLNKLDDFSGSSLIRSKGLNIEKIQESYNQLYEDIC